MKMKFEAEDFKSPMLTHFSISALAEVANAKLALIKEQWLAELKLIRNVSIVESRLKQPGGNEGVEMIKHHDLKTLPQYFDAVYNGRKTFEVRKNDRDFRSSDSVTLKEWSEEDGYSGREFRFTIGYVFPMVDNLIKREADTVVFSLLGIPQ